MKKILFFWLIFLFVNQTSFSKDLVFDDKAVKFNMSAEISNKVFLPATQNNLNPAIILLPPCSGINRGSETAMKNWSKLFIESGYFVLVLDHYRQRNAGKNCGKSRSVSFNTLTKDIYNATNHLSKIPGVDKNRIFSFGFSLGTMANGWAASKSKYNSIAKGMLRPRALGGLYGGCAYGKNKEKRFLFSDTDIPLIWLMGAKDTESPPSDCKSILKDISKKIKVESFVYESATHAWDMKALDGFKKIAGNGESVVYKYNENVTKDSMKRSLDFFNSFK
jgi:dienelactone hydrolase